VTGTVWLDGRLVAAAEARIDPADRGFLLGDGLFETMRARAGAVLRLNAHLARLRAGVTVLRIAPLPPDADIAAALDATLRANGLADAVLRLTVTRGPAGRGLPPPADARPTVLVTAAPPPASPDPARVVIARTTRRNENSPLCAVKSLNRLDDVLARVDAAERGADDALLLNNAGRLVESTVANLFAVIGGELVTPPLSDGALPGTVRAALIAGHGVVERPLTEADFAAADEAFLTNALGLRPVIACDGRPVGDGVPGPVARRLSDVLFD
jgi:branched-chain amino acid aminotransferase